MFAAASFPPAPQYLWRGERYENPRIRVGYVSGEFRQQATAILIAGLFERHDKSRFETFAFDNGWDDGSEIRGRINRAFDKIVDISRLDDAEAARAEDAMRLHDERPGNLERAVDFERDAALRVAERVEDERLELDAVHLGAGGELEHAV